MPTAEQQQTKKALKPRFKVDPAASPMPETKQPERLAPRATSNRKGGRDHLGILGEIKSVHPGEIIGIRTQGFGPKLLAVVRSAERRLFATESPPAWLTNRDCLIVLFLEDN